MISRKRESEKAILAAFLAWAGSPAMEGVNTYTSRQKRDNEAPQISVTCSKQGPLEGEEEYVTRLRVEGAITCAVLVDNQTPVRIEALEVLAENFVEMETDALLALINAESETVIFTDFQPGEYEDGFDSDTARYLARYTFSAFVRTKPEPETE